MKVGCLIMDNVTIGQIVTVLISFTTIITFGKLIYSFLKSHYIDVIDNLRKRLSKLEKEDEVQNADIIEGKKERLILLQGQLACLKGLKEQGCNGPVTKGISDIEEYLIKKSHE